jgi:hypothetical protein
MLDIRVAPHEDLSAMSRAVQSQDSPSNNWWKSRSLLEIADRLERTFEDQQALEARLAELLEENRRLQEHGVQPNFEDQPALQARLAEALEENRRLQQHIVQSNAEHVAQCNGLQAEIANLRLQASEMLTRLEKIAAVERRQEAEASAKERLIRDEQERKIQALQLELKNERNLNEKRMQQERSLNEKRLQQMQDRLANCICGDIQIEYDGKPARNSSSQGNGRWAIRNSK